MKRSTSEVQQSLGRQVQALRIANGLVQAELAERVNVSVSSINRLESGRSVGLDTFVAAVRALGREEWLDALDPVGQGPSPLEQLRMQRGLPQRRRRASRRQP